MNKTLTALTTGVLLLNGCAWVLLFAGLYPTITPWLGAAAAFAALALFCAHCTACRRDAERAEKRALQATQEHACSMEQAIMRNRREMDAFRSSLSHSLRMPVAIIQGYAELLTSGVITDPAVVLEYLEKISLRSQFMTEAISRQFSSVEELDSNRLTYSEFDLIEMIRQAVADIQNAAAEQGVTIQIVSSEPSLTVRADAYLLNRIGFNLLENSLKYMGRPGIITICILSEGENVSIRVQDDGLGLSSEETAHIFEPNFQGSNHTRGQGYGLYLVRRAIECHGGTVSAQSAPGRGMGITMTLPAMPPESTAQSVSASTDAE